MSVKHIGLILDHFEAKPAIKLVAIILADHADSDGLCWPSYRRIASRANMDERTVRRHVKALQEFGIVTKLRTGSVTTKNGQTIRISNAYRVNEAVILNRKKLSTDRLGMEGSVAHLEGGQFGRSRGGGLPTKPSFNQKDNHKDIETGDNSRDPLALEQVLELMIGKQDS